MKNARMTKNHSNPSTWRPSPSPQGGICERRPGQQEEAENGTIQLS